MKGIGCAGSFVYYGTSIVEDYELYDGEWYLMEERKVSVGGKEIVVRL